MKAAFTALVAAAALCLSNCSPTGLIFHNVTSPTEVTSAPGVREGRSHSFSLLGLIAIGDCSVATAKKNAGITTVSSVDTKHFSILSVYHGFTTIVTGN